MATTTTAAPFETFRAADTETVEALPETALAEGETPHATDAIKDTVADHVILGTGAGELSDLLGYSPGGMRNLMRSPDVQERVASRRQRLTEAGARSFFRFLMHADRLAQDQLGDALDRTSRDHYRARTWILERIMPQRQAATAEVNVALAINQEVMVQLSEAIKATTNSLGSAHSGTPVLLEGKKALPPIDK